MGSLKENINITWNNFESRLSSSFADIWSQSKFLDVTLTAMAEDGTLEALQAHKVILSAASPVLKELLDKHTYMASNAPVILYLQNFSARHLSLILEFIYRGRVSLPQDELTDFLGVAKSLQIPLEDVEDPNPASVEMSTHEDMGNKMADGPKVDRPKLERSKVDRSKVDRPKPVPAKRPFQPEDDNDQITRPELKVGKRKKIKTNRMKEYQESIKREPNPKPDVEICEVIEDDYEDPLVNTNSNTDPPTVVHVPTDFLVDTAASKESFITNNVTMEEEGFRCNPCNKLLTSKRNIARHVEDQHIRAGVKFQCPKCPHISKSKSSLQSHVSRKHRDSAIGTLNYEQYALYQSD